MTETRDQIPFRKMNGLGNDFVVLDAREAPIPLDPDQARAIADRRTGIGCDQLITLEPSKAADLFMRIRNADGGEVDACGNATRCIADLVMAETGGTRVTVETNAGILDCIRAGEHRVTIDIGPPKLEWHEIPIAERMDTRVIELQIGPIDAPVLHSPSVVNVGNPHCFFWVDDVEAHDLSKIGPLLEHHPIFPERANISLAHVTSPTSITLKVWERGAGLTRACGTAACAVVVAAARRKLTGRKVTVTLPGGDLEIEWRESDGHVLMTGPVAYEFDGVLDPGLLEGVPAA
jgi:diaminopimelate epimerase